MHLLLTPALATLPVILIVYVASRSVIFALERSSFAVIVMFRVSPKVASEVLKLLLYMVRFESAGSVCVDYDVCRCSILCYVKFVTGYHHML